jgi:hypothetical protein
MTPSCILDLTLGCAALAITGWDWRRHRRGVEARPWWRVWLALAVLFFAFALLAPGGVLRHGS